MKQYPEDYPYPSCLILGKCRQGKLIHAVVGLHEGVICCMITAYRPDADKWEVDLKTRKGLE
ncbi:MAG: DUF4258 domain-containing protein [Defluviitaleaceae bacterium]|nr:DUF4258 domain-containing protein [Defluviitaleaceae bacterium]